MVVFIDLEILFACRANGGTRTSVGAFLSPAGAAGDRRDPFGGDRVMLDPRIATDPVEPDVTEEVDFEECPYL
jgi:hypothetical protein